MGRVSHLSGGRAGRVALGRSRWEDKRKYPYVVCCRFKEVVFVIYRLTFLWLWGITVAAGYLEKKA